MHAGGAIGLRHASEEADGDDCHASDGGVHPALRKLAKYAARPESAPCKPWSTSHESRRWSAPAQTRRVFGMTGLIEGL